MVNLIGKQFLKNWRVWGAVLPIFLVSGLIFSTSLTILEAINQNGTSSVVDYGVFVQMPIIIGGIVLIILTNNAMRQCIDLFDESTDILLLLGASPLQLSGLMTGQLLVVGVIGAIAGSLISLPAARVFLALIPDVSTSQGLATLRLEFSGQAVLITLLTQVGLIIFTSMRYCLKNYGQRKGSLSAYKSSNEKKVKGFFVGLVGILTSFVATVLLLIKEVPNPNAVAEYNSSMNDSMSLLLLTWLMLIIGMNFLMRPLFKVIVRKAINLTSISRTPTIRSAFYNLKYNEEGVIKLSRPLVVIILLVGNFIALFLNTKLLIDGNNSSGVLSDLLTSLIFLFGAPIIISLANIITSTCLFKIKTKDQMGRYFYSGCTPQWIFNLKIIEVGLASGISILITFLGMILFSVPVLRVAALGGGKIFKANWSFNILITLGVFLFFFLCIVILNYAEKKAIKAYMKSA